MDGRPERRACERGLTPVATNVANLHKLVWPGIIVDGGWKIGRQRVHLAENFDQNLGRRLINWAGGILVDLQSCGDLYQLYLKLFYLHSQYRSKHYIFKEFGVLTSATTEEGLLLPNGRSQYRLPVHQQSFCKQYLELLLTAIYVLASDDFNFESSALTSCGTVSWASCSFVIGTSRRGAFLEPLGRPRGRFFGSEWFIVVEDENEFYKSDPPS
jgi:hypothetical protein